MKGSFDNFFLITDLVNGSKNQGNIVKKLDERWIKNGEVSHDIALFIHDPVLFTTLNAISSDNISDGRRLPARGRVKFIKIAPNSYSIEYIYSNEQNNSTSTLGAYFLGYNGANQAITSPPYIDIPITAVDEKFLFTGTLSGCSIIVTKLNETTYRVFHDERVNSSILYDNVVMAFDFIDYQVPGTDEGLAAVYMRYTEDKWQLLLQRQEYRVINEQVLSALRDDMGSISDYVAEPERFIEGQFSEYSRQKFIFYREDIHQKLKEIGSQFHIEIDSVTDGTYSRHEFSLSHPAILPWITLRNKIKESVDLEMQFVINKLTDLHIELNELNHHEVITRADESRREEIKELIKIQTNIKEFYRRKYINILNDVVSTERSWLWLQIKYHEGSNTVIQLGDEAIQGGRNNRLSNESINQRYLSAIIEHKKMKNPQFDEGKQHYTQTAINGFSDEMSSLQMKELYVTSELSAKERGALSVYIEEKTTAEYTFHVLNNVSKMNDFFQKMGCIKYRSAPQDFYLPLMGEKLGGRCYPLVRAMSVALATHGQENADILLNRMFIAAASPQERSSILLKDALANLHSSTDAAQVSVSLDWLNLNQIQAVLEKSTSMKMYALNSATHSMLLGKTVKEGDTFYHFYDPNFGLFTFDKSQKIFTALKEFMTSKGMASFYSANGTGSKPEFKLVEMEYEYMAEVPVGSGLVVSDLIHYGELEDIVEQRRLTNQVVENQESLTTDMSLRSSLSLLTAEQWADKLNNAFNQLIRINDLNEEWLPIFESIQKIDGEKYHIEFIHQDGLRKKRTVETNDPIFLDFREYMNVNIDKLSEHYSFNDDDGLFHESCSGEIAHVNGLNAAQSIQVLIQWITNKNRQEITDNPPSNLVTALKIHSYVNYIMMTKGTFDDSIKVTELIYSLWRTSLSVVKVPINNFVLSLANIANEGVGTILQGAMVGLDIYELANAQNEAQRAVFGTQLAFDATILGTEAAATYAGVAGLTGVSIVLAGAGEILGGLSIGVTGLVQAFSGVAEHAKAVGVYFHYLDLAYQGDGFNYIQEKSLLNPILGGVFKKVDLRAGQIEFDSQYIYRTSEHSSGGGRHNYIFWVGNFPHVITNKEQALNIREKIGYVEPTRSLMNNDAEMIVLPATPKSYINYTYNLLPGATTRNDLGFDVIRRIENTDQFDYDFYIWPSENIITRLFQEYVYTPIDVLLCHYSKHLIVPKIPSEFYGKLHYQIIGASGEYQISINHGCKIKLSDDSVDKTSCWIIDTSLLDEDAYEVQLFEDYIKISDIIIDIDPSAHTNIIKLVNKKHEIHAIDFINKTVSIVSEDGQQWVGKASSIKQHLDEEMEKHQSRGGFVQINNYQYQEKNVGTAYYDVTLKRIIFTNSTNEENQSAILVGFFEENAYFYSKQKHTLWMVDIKTGVVKLYFDIPHLLGYSARIIRAWDDNQEPYIYVEQRIDDNAIKITYKIINNKLLLLGIENNTILINELKNTPTHLQSSGLQSFLQHDYLVYGNHIRPILNDVSEHMRLDLNETVMITGVDSEGFLKRFWLRTHNQTLIKPNLEALRGPYDMQTGRSLWRMPEDLILIGNFLDENGGEIFFFYSRQEGVIFRQEGLGQDIFNPHIPTAKVLGVRFIKNILHWQGNLVAVGHNGVLTQINIDGSFQIVAFNEKWFKDNLYWVGALYELEENYLPITLIGLKTINGNRLLPAWYYNKSVILIHSLEIENTEVLQFLGANLNRSGAIIFDTQSGKLYHQDPLDDSTLRNAFIYDKLNIDLNQLPASIRLYSNMTFKRIVKVDTGLMMLSESNELIYHPMLEGGIGSTLILRGSKNNDTFLPPYIKEVTTLILDGSEGSDVYQFSQESWQHYQTIIIDNHAVDQQLDEIVLPIKECLNSVFAHRQGNDLIISDYSNATLLILREVYNAKAELSRHAVIKMDEMSSIINVGSLAEKISESHGLTNLRRYLDEQFHQEANASLLTEHISQAKQMNDFSSWQQVSGLLDIIHLDSRLVGMNKVD